MKSFRKKIYFHMDKDGQIWDIEKQAESQGFSTERLRFLGYEVEMEIEIYEDGTNKILSITSSNGQKIDVSDKEIAI